MIAIPEYTNLLRFHASILNDYTAALLACWDHATAPTFPFQGSGVSNNEVAWSGYILHTVDTFRYRYILTNGKGLTGTVKIYVDDTEIYSDATTGLRDGSIDISSLSLTVNQVYAVRLENVDGYKVDVQWLGETKTVAYTATPAFSDTDVLEASDLQAIYTGITEVQTAIDRGCNSFPWGNQGLPGNGNGEYCKGSNDYLFIGKWSFVHAHDTLRYRFRHGTQIEKVKTDFRLSDGTVIYSVDEGTFDRTRTGTIDMSGYGISIGDIYTIEVRTQLQSTSATAEIFCIVSQLSEESALTVTPPPIWVHGGQNINAANLNRYGAIIDLINPSAGDPTAPAFYEVPAVRSPYQHRFRIQHRYRWLRYVTRTGRTTEMTYGAGLTKVKLPTGTGNQSYDLSQVPNLGLGDYYELDDAEYAQEADSSQS